MKKSKRYARMFVTADVLIAARALLLQRANEAYRRERDALSEEERQRDGMVEEEVSAGWGHYSMSIDLGEEEWSFDDPIEFFAELRSFPATARGDAHFEVSMWGIELTVWIYGGQWPGTNVSVDADSRAQIQEIFEVFEAAVPGCTVPAPEPEVVEEQPPPPAPVVFIGHGHSTAWRDLKDHLADKHGIDVEAYETGSRSGHAVRDVLAQMMNRASLALLVMTGEDETGDGAIRARQNVVHEAGLFQGSLGFEKAVALVEEGVEVFSNLDGVDQIRFPKGAISQTYGDVLAWIRRETGVR